MTENTDWRPTSGVEVARLRAAMLNRLRACFQSNGLLEVDTPALSPTTVSDPNIESIAASLSLDQHRNYYLHTSPEYRMKRLLCAGYPDIFQISKVFRDNEAGCFHQPEFTMVEWYRLNFDLQQIIQDTIGVIAAALDADSLRSDAQQFSYQEAYREFADCNALNDDALTLSNIVHADDSLKLSVGDNRDAWLDLLLDEKIAPRFAPDKLTVLYHYPIGQAALARQCPSDDRLADRFEIFLGNNELANGYVELTDADEQARRFTHEQRLRKSRGQKRRPLDTALLSALESGLPPCAGVAVGLDRLLMIMAGADDIRTIQTFAFVEQESECHRET